MDRPSTPFEGAEEGRQCGIFRELVPQTLALKSTLSKGLHSSPLPSSHPLLFPSLPLPPIPHDLLEVAADTMAPNLHLPFSLRHGFLSPRVVLNHTAEVT